MIELQNIDVIFNQGTEIENHVLKGINLKVCDSQFVSMNSKQSNKRQILLECS